VRESKSLQASPRHREGEAYVNVVFSVREVSITGPMGKWIRRQQVQSRQAVSETGISLKRSRGRREIERGTKIEKKSQTVRAQMKKNSKWRCEAQRKWRRWRISREHPTCRGQRSPEKASTLSLEETGTEVLTMSQRHQTE